MDNIHKPGVLQNTRSSGHKTNVKPTTYSIKALREIHEKKQQEQNKPKTKIK